MEFEKQVRPTLDINSEADLISALSQYISSRIDGEDLVESEVRLFLSDRFYRPDIIIRTDIGQTIVECKFLKSSKNLRAVEMGIKQIDNYLQALPGSTGVVYVPDPQNNASLHDSDNGLVKLIY